MRITVVAVGQRQPAWAQHAVDDYLARFPADFKVELKEVKAEPRSGKGNEPVQRLMAAEAARIRAAVPADGRIVALDERGADWTTDSSLRRSVVGATKASTRCSSSADRTVSIPELKQWRPRAGTLVEPDPAACPRARDAGRAVLPGMVNAGQSPVPSRLMHTSFYLASRSPRRRELLKQLDVKFDPLLLRMSGPRGADVDESSTPGESAADYVERTAREKAAFGLRVLGMRSMVQRPVLAADTVVIVDGDVLGKPADRAEAEAFLTRLSGRAHEVRTTVALAMEGPVSSSTSVSTVSFRALTEDESETLLRHLRAVRQGRRLRHPGSRGALHRADRRQLHRRDGAAAVRDRAPADAGGVQAALIGFIAAARLAVGGGRDFRGGEQRRPEGGARSALRV